MPLRALIFDLDGTAVPNSPDGMPSQGVLQAVGKAKERVKVACATGRELVIAKPVIDRFQFLSPCIIAGGAQIVDPISYVPLWEKILTEAKIREIVEIASNLDYNLVALSDDGPEKKARDYDYFCDKPILFLTNVDREDGHAVAAIFASIQGISVIPVQSWIPGKVDIHITNIAASKKHALEEWMKIEGVTKEEVIAIGDSGNDLPLFELAGIKVAMGNASNTLKEQADWVAPSVDDDGLAVMIEKYIFS